jgi:hypothetical protein
MPRKNESASASRIQVEHETRFELATPVLPNGQSFVLVATFNAPHREIDPGQHGKMALSQHFGSIAMRELLDHVIVTEERHLQRGLREYVGYNNIGRIADLTLGPE